MDDMLSELRGDYDLYLDGLAEWVRGAVKEAMEVPKEFLGPREHREDIPEKKGGE